MFELNFGATDKPKYDLIYEALIGSGQKSLEEDPTTFIDVLRKMRTLGVLTDDEAYKRSRVPVYVFDKPGTISFTKAEFNCLKSNFSKSRFQTWTIETAQEIKEWLDGIKETSREDTK